MKTQSLPHVGVKNGWTRKGKTICTQPETKAADGTILPPAFRSFDSISRAKRFMRIGE